MKLNCQINVYGGTGITGGDRDRDRDRGRLNLRRNDDGREAETVRGRERRGGIVSEGVVREIETGRGAIEGSVPRETGIVRENGILERVSVP